MITSSGEMLWSWFSEVATPFVFRPVDDASETKRYTLVGSVYVRGVMYGELKEESGPAGFQRMVLVYLL